MGRMIGSLLFCCLAVGAASALLAAPGQGRAGDIEPAKVWIQNRGGVEAVPVTIEGLSPDLPVRVQVTAMPPIAMPDTIQTRLARQVWEYQGLIVSPAQNAVTLLNDAGRDGWEASGLQFTTAAGTTIVLKRPR